MSGRYDNWRDIEPDSDEDDEVQEDYKYTKQAVLWAIEATDDMLAPILVEDDSPPSPSAGPTPTPSATTRPTSSAVSWKGKPARSKMEQCLRAVYATMKRKVISSPKDLVGIIIYNTETQKSGDAALESSHFLLDLAQVDAQNIRKMKELLEQVEEDPDYLPNLFKPNEGQNAVAGLFGMCNSIFRLISPNAHNTVFLVTDNDDPVFGSAQLTNVTREQRGDLHDLGYAVEPFLIPRKQGAEFDLEKFWGEVLTSVEGDDEAVTYPVVNRNLQESLTDMVEAMRTKEAGKRVAFKIPFVLGQGLVIGIAGYNLVGEESKRLPVKVDLNTAAGEEVISKTVYKDGDTGSELDPKSDIKKFFQVGQEDYERGIQSSKIFFSEADIRKVKTIGRPPSLKLLGFKPRADHLKFEETVKHSYFIYPDEDRYSGSTRTFASLLKLMIKKNVIGYASMVARTSSKPQVVVLIPQEEKLNSAGVAVTPPGIHICQLPFADDIRDHGLESTVSVLVPPDPDADEDDVPEQPAVDLAKKIIGKYSKKGGYNPDDYPNPALNYFYETLAAVALDEEPPEQDDHTLPAYEVIEDRVGKYIRKLKSLIPEDEVDPSRIATSKSKRPVNKKTEVKNEGSPPDLSEFLQLMREKGGKVTVPELKKGLKMMGEKTSGNKSDLLDRVEAYLVAHGLAEAKQGDSMHVDGSDEDVKPKMSSQKKKRRKVAVEDESE
ncbi:hypothetical protein JCM8547_003331 [Rhodosporidiobolus lusitaniae]